LPSLPALLPPSPHRRRPPLALRKSWFAADERLNFEGCRSAAASLFVFGQRCGGSLGDGGCGGDEVLPSCLAIRSGRVGRGSGRTGAPARESHTRSSAARIGGASVSAGAGGMAGCSDASYQQRWARGDVTTPSTAILRRRALPAPRLGEASAAIGPPGAPSHEKRTIGPPTASPIPGIPAAAGGGAHSLAARATTNG
jgi:hypothetical protein